MWLICVEELGPSGPSPGREPVRRAALRTFLEKNKCPGISLQEPLWVITLSRKCNKEVVPSGDCALPLLGSAAHVPHDPWLRCVKLDVPCRWHATRGKGFGSFSRCCHAAVNYLRHTNPLLHQSSVSAVSSPEATCPGTKCPVPRHALHLCDSLANVALWGNQIPILKNGWWSSMSAAGFPVGFPLKPPKRGYPQERPTQSMSKRSPIGWTKSCTSWKLREPLFVGFLKGNHHARAS